MRRALEQITYEAALLVRLHDHGLPVDVDRLRRVLSDAALTDARIASSVNKAYREKVGS